MNLNEILSYRRILITGGTGSFGNALISRILESKVNVDKIYVLSRDENKQQEMALKRLNENVEFIIADIRDKNRLLKAFKGVTYVFHAAALKHVPIGEKFPEEVIMTNVIGTKNVIEAAEECGVEKVVNLSSDKAVYPINAYGMTKALAEKIVSAHTGYTKCVNLRYGNVLGSRGSVLPVFLNQIKKEKPITITDKKMTRFLLLLRDAVDLSFMCLQEGKSGDLFVIKSPACTIYTLTKALEMHYKYRINEEVIGIRAGEKIHETLLTSEELKRAVDIEIDGVCFARIPAIKTDIKAYFKGEEKDCLTFPPFTSENTVQLGHFEVYEILKTSGVLD